MGEYTSRPYSYAPTESGHIASPGVWNGSSAIMGAQPGNPGGMRIQLHTEFDSQSRPIEPRMIWPSFSMRFHLRFTLALDAIYQLSFVPEAAPDSYSNNALPDERDETILSNKDGDSFDLYGATPVRVSAGSTEGDPVLFSDVDPEPIIQYMRSSSYNGYIAFTLTTFTLDWAGLGCPVYTHNTPNTQWWPILTTEEIGYHTGILDGPAVGRRSRSRHCPRTGMPVASDAMVRDGYSEGLMVSQEAWDPENPEDRYVPNPNEGVVDDEV